MGNLHVIWECRSEPSWLWARGNWLCSRDLLRQAHVTGGSLISDRRDSRARPSSYSGRFGSANRRWRTREIVIPRRVSRGTSSRFSPLPSHNASPMSYHARRRAAEFRRKTQVLQSGKIAQINQYSFLVFFWYDLTTIPVCVRCASPGCWSCSSSRRWRLRRGN